MKLARTDNFSQDFVSFPDDARKAAAKQIAQLLIDHTHPSLQIEGIAGMKGVFSIRVNIRYRISLSFENDDTIVLRRVLDHDDLYKNP